jgi:hypothetical protein
MFLSFKLEPNLGAYLFCPWSDPFPLHTFDPVGSWQYEGNSFAPNACSHFYTVPAAWNTLSSSATQSLLTLLSRLS